MERRRFKIEVDDYITAEKVLSIIADIGHDYLRITYFGQEDESTISLYKGVDFNSRTSNIVTGIIGERFVTKGFIKSSKGLLLLSTRLGNLERAIISRDDLSDSSCKEITYRAA